jgi:hypothetical protein
LIICTLILSKINLSCKSASRIISKVIALHNLAEMHLPVERQCVGHVTVIKPESMGSEEMKRSEPKSVKTWKQNEIADYERTRILRCKPALPNCWCGEKKSVRSRCSNRTTPRRRGRSARKPFSFLAAESRNQREKKTAPGKDMSLIEVFLYYTTNALKFSIFLECPSPSPVQSQCVEEIPISWFPMHFLVWKNIRSHFT